MSETVRVFVDATSCKSQQGGVRTYTLAMCEALASHDGVSLAIATSISDFDELPVDIIRVSSATQAPAARALWRERTLSSAVRRAGSAVVFSPIPELPLRQLPVPSVVVVHDIGPLVAPGLYGRSRWLRYRATLPHTLRMATRVVCVSAATRSELISRFRIDASKCVVVGEGPQFLDPVGVVDGADDDEPYVLYVGSLYRHKNVSTLARAWQYGGAIQNVGLRVAGLTDDKDGVARLVSAAREAGIQSRFSLAGFLEPGHLARLLGGAEALALPSLYEGFGLTALEAMAAGIPIVASAIPAIVEVVGDAGVLVHDPLSPRSWHAALCSVVNDPQLRLELAEKGRARARARHVGACGR